MYISGTVYRIEKPKAVKRSRLMEVEDMNYKIVLNMILALLVLAILSNLPSISLEQECELRMKVDSCIVNSSANWVLLINAKNHYIEDEDIEVNLVIVRLGNEVEGAMNKLSTYTCCLITRTNGTIVYEPHSYLNLLTGLNESIMKRVDRGDVFYAFSWRPFTLKGRGCTVWHPELDDKSRTRYIVHVHLSISEKRNNAWLLRNFMAKFPINVYGRSIILPAIPFPYNCTRIGVFLYGNWRIAIGHIGDRGFVNLTYAGKEPLRVKYLLHPLISHLEVVKVYDNGKSVVIRKLGYYFYNKTELIYPGTSDSMEFKNEHNVTLIYVRGKLPDNSTVKLYLPLKGELRIFKYLCFKKPWIMECIGDWVIYIKRDYMIPRDVEPEVHVIFARVNETPVKIQYFSPMYLVAIDIYYPNRSKVLEYYLPPGVLSTKTIGREILWNFTWKPSTLFKPSRTLLDPGQYIMHVKLWVDEVIDEKLHRSKSIEYTGKHMLIVTKRDSHLHEYIGMLYAGPWILKLIYIEETLKTTVNVTYSGLVSLAPTHGIIVKLHVYYPNDSECIILKFNKSRIKPGESLLRNVTLSGKPMLIVLSSDDLPKYGKIKLYLPILFKVEISEALINLVTELNVSSSSTTTSYEVREFVITLILMILALIEILVPTLMAIYILRTKAKRNSK